MADLTFATKGQAEALAAQEAIRKKALDTKLEFEAGAKATKAWDADLMRLKGQGEGALRSIQTEQEKIVDKIAKIQQAQEKGLIPPQEAEEAIKRLRQEWVDVDEATQKARDATEQVSAAHAELKSKAMSALEGIRTEEEKIEEQIHDIEAAMEAGLIPPEAAEKGIKKLKESLHEVSESGNRLGGIFAKAFDPAIIVKWGLSFIGVKALIGGIRSELQDVQDLIDKRVAEFLKPKEKRDALAAAESTALDEYNQAKDNVAELREQLEATRQGDDVVAWRAATDAEFAARMERDARQRRWLEAQEATAKFDASPEGRNLREVQSRGEALDQAIASLSAAAGGGVPLSAEERRKVDVAKGLSGTRRFARVFEDWADWALNDDYGTRAGAIRQLRAQAEGVRGLVPDEETGFYRQRSDAELTGVQRQQLIALEEVIRLLSDINSKPGILGNAE